MPSSLIIVALAAAWLIVLVPMVARKRQEVARPADSALSARIVRSGSVRDERREEFAMSENAAEHDVRAEAEPFDAADADEDVADRGDDGVREYEAVDDVGEYEDIDEYERDPGDRLGQERGAAPEPRRYRPGRGGFDPEAAEIAARAKYTYRQRVVVGLLCAAVVTAIVAAALLPVAWWLHALVDVSLVGYLVYLRRQVRIENEIRERRLARLGHAGAPTGHDQSESARYEQERHAASFDGHGEDGYVDSPEDYDEAVADGDLTERRARMMARPARKPAPEPIQHNGVYVDQEDDDPAFHELDQPGEQPFRKAVGQ